MSLSVEALEAAGVERGSWLGRVDSGVGKLWKSAGRIIVL